MLRLENQVRVCVLTLRGSIAHILRSINLYVFFACLLAAGQAGAATYTFVGDALHDTRGGPNDDTIYFAEFFPNQTLFVGDILNVTINFSGATNPIADRTDLQFFINGEPSRFTCISCFLFDVNWTVNGQAFPTQTITEREADLSLANVNTLNQVLIVATLVGVSNQSPSASLSLNEMILDAQIIPGIPLPAALPLFAAGVGMLGLIGWRRKRMASGATASTQSTG